MGGINQKDWLKELAKPKADPFETSVNRGGMTVNLRGLKVNPDGLTVNPSGLAVNQPGMTVNLSGLTVNQAGMTVNLSGITSNLHEMPLFNTEIQNHVFFNFKTAFAFPSNRCYTTPTSS